MAFVASQDTPTSKSLVNDIEQQDVVTTTECNSLLFTDSDTSDSGSNIQQSITQFSQYPPLPGKKRTFPHVRSVVARYIEAGRPSLNIKPKARSIKYRPVIKLLERHELKTIKFTVHPISIIGNGVFGEVILGECRELGGKVCAVKKILIRDEDGAIIDDHIESFRNELAALKAVTKSGNPFTQVLLGSSRTSRYGIIATEFSINNDLEFVRKTYETSGFPDELARFYCAEIIAGLGQFHELGYVHRDVKPPNIFIDSRGHVKIGDFGTALKSDVCTENHHTGTLEFMSPERILGMPYGKSSDFWSVAVIMHCLMFHAFPKWNSDIPKLEMNINFEGDKQNQVSDYSVSKANLIDFIEKSLSLNERTRLGHGPDGLKNIMADPYLSGIDWNLLSKGKLTPPVIPSTGKKPFKILPPKSSFSKDPIPLYTFK